MGKSYMPSESEKPARPKWQTRGRQAHRLSLEDGIRQELQDSSIDTSTPSDIEQSDALRALASADELEERYLRDRNPVHVFAAINQISFACRALRVPIDFPPWITAYLLASSKWIMGRAVSWPPEPKAAPVAIRRPDGSVHRVGMSLKGLSAAARLDTVLEGLLFKPGPGRNPILQGHRFYASIDRARKYKRNRSKHLSSDEAIATMEDPQLGVADPQRKLKRDRHRTKGPKPTP